LKIVVDAHSPGQCVCGDLISAPARLHYTGEETMAIIYTNGDFVNEEITNNGTI